MKVFLLKRMGKDRNTKTKLIEETGFSGKEGRKVWNKKVLRTSVRRTSSSGKDLTLSYETGGRGDLLFCKWYVWCVRSKTHRSISHQTTPRS